MSSSPLASMFVVDAILPKFAPSVDIDKYKCCKCHGMLRPPVKQTSCGHRICSICLEELLQSSNTMCPGQDLDDEMCVDLKTSYSVTPDAATERDLKRLPVLCDYELYGCRETPTWFKKAKHVAQCKFQPHECPNKSNGCSFKDIASKLNGHKLDCMYALKNCPHCRRNITSGQYEEHVQECRTRPQQCPYALSGCTFQGSAEAVKKHEHDPKMEVQHLSMFNNRTAALETTVEKGKETIDQLTKEKEELTVKSVSGCNGSPETNNIREDKNINKFNFRVSSLDASQRTNGIGSTEDNSSKLYNLESTVGMHDIRLAEYDLRFQCMESAGYDGILIWKIKDYQRRKMDAISGRTLSLYSQPFYTSRFGYKMCARVYLNGDGMGKGTHMSLFFVIMKGDYDALLPWPFRQKVSLTLMDVDGGRKHLTDTFRPDPTSTSFRLPVGDMNIASGCPLFVAQSILETRTYIQDDTIYIKIAVDTEESPPFPIQQF